MRLEQIFIGKLHKYIVNSNCTHIQPGDAEMKITYVKTQTLFNFSFILLEKKCMLLNIYCLSTVQFRNYNFRSTFILALREHIAKSWSELKALTEQ